MTEPKELDNNAMKCRICLKIGTIPIYGENSASDLSFEVRTFGDIDVYEDDVYPKTICEACYGLLQSAILFRKTAKNTDVILRETCLKSDCESEISPNLDVNSDSDEYDCHEDTNERPSQWTTVQQYFLDLSTNENYSNKTAICPNLAQGKRVQCRVCNKIVSKSHSRDHYAIHDPTLPKYICDICGKSFRQQSAQINHKLTHSTDFKHKCQMCAYKGRSSGLLRAHMKTHTGDYQYMCAECPARFLTKSNLNKHSLKHKNPSFKCEHCKKAFHTKLSLQRHNEVDHLGVKNHTCEICGKAFGYRKAMMRHQLDVHKREKKPNGRTPSYLQNDQTKNDIQSII